MAKRKYIDYTFEELIHDQEFVEVIQNISNEKEWREFLDLHQDSKKNILRAKRFISLFWMKKDQLNTDVKHDLWLKIREFNKTNERKNRSVRLRPIVRFAASVLVIFSLSSILYFGLNRHGNDYIFSEADSTSNSKNTVLTLSNGEKIEVRKDESKIRILEDETIEINKDTIFSTKTITSTTEELEMNELMVPFGRKTSLVLNDGTKVWLNAGSKFAFPQKFTGKTRKVFLDGEGYFEVSKNTEQPFIVSSKNISVEVLGTKFNMSAYSEDKTCETVLLEGSVNIWNENKLIKNKFQLSPNQKATYNLNEKQLLVKHEPEAENYIAWVDGWYKYSNENLEQVLVKVGRYYDVTFIYNSDAIIKALPISGKLDLNRSFEDVMETLSKVAEIDYEVEERKVIIN